MSDRYLGDKSEASFYEYQGYLIRIIYEDNHLIGAVKPAGMLSQADGSDTPDILTALKSYIREKYQKPGEVWLGLVHRLDQPVSGVMIFARTSKAASRLSEQVRNRKIGKKYLAVVQGDNIPESGFCRDYLWKNEKTGKVFVVSQNSKDFSKAKAADLEYCLLAKIRIKQQNINLLSIKLGSGRGHQIRVQLSHRGWPILGDGRYGGLADFITKTTDKDGKVHTDLALFSYELSFSHPTQKEIIILSALPAENLPWNMFDQSLDTILNKS